MPSPVDKNEAMLTLLRSCTAIANNPLFFNFGNVEAGAHQLISNYDDVALQKPYIDGSVEKCYTANIDCYKSVAYVPIVGTQQGILPDENLGDFAEAQAILDWIEAQGEARNFPNFGSGCVVDDMKVTSAKPQLVGIDTSVSPPVADYRITVKVYYIDNTQRLWT